MDRRLFLYFLSTPIAIPIMSRTSEAGKLSVPKAAIKLAYRTTQLLYALYTGSKNKEEAIKDFHNIYARNNIYELTKSLIHFKNTSKNDAMHELLNAYKRKNRGPRKIDEENIIKWLGRVWDLISAMSREDIKQLLQLLLRENVVDIQIIKNNNGDIVVDSEGQPIMVGPAHPIFQKAWRILSAGEN